MALRPGKGRVIQNHALGSPITKWSPTRTIAANTGLLMKLALWLSGRDPVP